MMLQLSEQPSAPLNRTVVVCDDDRVIRSTVSTFLEKSGFDVLAAEDGRQCLRYLENQRPAVVLLDLHMPDMDGLETIRRARAQGIDTPFIVMTGHSTVDSAVDATRLGAVLYLSKPLELEQVAIATGRVIDQAARRRLSVDLDRIDEDGGYGRFIGRSTALAEVFAMLRRLESVDAPRLLIHGESGTGKDVLAHALHEHGPRKNGPFVEVDCASLPDTLIESELFGHERGAFTDAKNAKPGMFEVAHGGTLFLDEIGEIPLTTQAKLLRALESHRFKRVGGVRPIQLDVAVLAASNRDLKAEVARGNFREDLFFRLNVLPVHIPPLRRRMDDIPVLVRHFLHALEPRIGRRISYVSEEAMAKLMSYPWPGNVRELRNVLEYASILCEDDTLRLDDLPASVRYANPNTSVGALEGCPLELPEEGVDLELLERGLIIQALRRAGGSRTKAGALLGISRHALRYRLEKHGIED